jgi:hydrogenase maturation factor HypF (carbamoyltransferase family)
VIFRCAWCEAELPEDQRDHSENVSHGICGPHLEAWKKEWQETQLAKATAKLFEVLK